MECVASFIQEDNAITVVLLRPVTVTRLAVPLNNSAGPISTSAAWYPKQAIVISITCVKGYIRNLILSAAFISERDRVGKFPPAQV